MTASPVKSTLQTKTALTTTGLSTLASATYVASNAYDLTANDNEDCLIEVALATTNAVAGNKQCKVFVVVSLDAGSTFSSGPTSGTTTTDEPDLYLLGVVPMNTSTTTHRETFSLFMALGFMPQQFKVVIFNDVGVALTSGTISTAEILQSVG